MQKLRKKAGLVSTDAVDVYVGVDDACASSGFESLLAGVLEAQVRGAKGRFYIAACALLVVALAWQQILMRVSCTTSKSHFPGRLQ